MKFTHLHLHSHYSLLDGLSKIDQLIDKVKKDGGEALALTDHGNMYGIIEFYGKCLAAGIKPIIGCEVYISPRKMTDKVPTVDRHPYHLVLLAKNIEGYLNLLDIVSAGHLIGHYYHPRVDWDYLQPRAKGLIALSACAAGQIPRLILANKMDAATELAKQAGEMFGKNNFYLEIQPHFAMVDQIKINEGIIKISQETGLPLVATCDSHYLDLEDKQAHEILLAIQTNKEYDDEKRLTMREADFHLRTQKEMIDAFGQTLPEAINNSQSIAEKCDIKLEFGQLVLPHFSLPDGETLDGYLKKLCLGGLKKRYPHPESPQLNQRLNYELKIIKQAGFSEYFLIVADLVNWAKKQGIVVGPGRGSAAGSLATYCLNITNLDPIKYELLFERFLNPERISPPDFDLDFADDRRQEVLDYLAKKYGFRHVAQIITFGVMKARLVIRDVGRALKIAYGDCDRLAKMIPFGLDLDQAIESVSDLQREIASRQEVKQLIATAKKLEGVVRHASTHAAGVVITGEPLTHYLPLQRSTSGKEEGLSTTQYSMYDVDKLGLLKIDILGLANLTVIKNALRIIKKVDGQDIDINKIPLDDPAAFHLLAKAQTTGVFQLESPGMKRYLKELKPTVFEDIISIVALYRPGPMDSIPDFIAAKNGARQAKYLHPSLKPILEKTYGVIVTQEQVLEIARQFAGFTYGQADILRKAVGKKIKKLLIEQRQKFITGAVKTQNVSFALAERVWNFIEPFARYGFNRSHSACYAMIAYQTAYLKTHYPKPFMAALLTSDFNNLDRIGIEINECKNSGIDVLPPDVNESFVEFGVINDVIRFGLAAIKNVGAGAAEIIVNERQENGRYENLEDFLLRLNRVLNKKIIEALAKSGAMDSLGERNQMLAGVDKLVKFAAGRPDKTGNQMGLFGQGDLGRPAAIELPNIEPASQRQKLTWEKELLGIYVSEHPLEQFRQLLGGKTLSLNELNYNHHNHRVQVAGIITNIKQITTKTGELMLFAQIDDGRSATETVVFPRTLRQSRLAWQKDNIVLITGRAVGRDKEGNHLEQVKIIVDEVRELGHQETL
ncbi:MAG: DNA polymerase III subunit alpha [Candidatus Berkelbacteria bacterium Licking1014_2]|uniref:DNA polymerase III subunit alpha n=1 Tax=Candidatus Berkelbacteria bacterium Licking1014_2 TaxID=2017146 RepID=A0A554LUI3_9BACT|nr:MAG: DNA polymerase III subunit alpha [Candidatus Berkelbacteria bacterium Licking1014_2]